MIALEFEDALALLKARGPVAVVRFVDSPHDAVAFADRRPIGLFLSLPLADGSPLRGLRELRSDESIRRAYALLAAQSRRMPGVRIVAGRVTEPAAVGEAGESR